MRSGRIAVVVFDVDGTLHRGSVPLKRHTREIAARLPSADGARFEALAAARLAGRALLPGEDDWNAPAALALDIELAPGALRQALFLQHPLSMVDSDCPLNVAAGLVPLVTRLTADGGLASWPVMSVGDNHRETTLRFPKARAGTCGRAGRCVWVPPVAPTPWRRPCHAPWPGWPA